MILDLTGLSCMKIRRHVNWLLASKVIHLFMVKSYFQQARERSLRIVRFYPFPGRSLYVYIVQLRCQYFKIITALRKYRYNIATERQYEFKRNTKGKKKFLVRVIIWSLCVCLELLVVDVLPVPL